MAPPADLREWIRLLEHEGELVRVSAEVDPHLEITEIAHRVVKARGQGRSSVREAMAQGATFGTSQRQV